jgi:hypothetical protein
MNLLEHIVNVRLIGLHSSATALAAFRSRLCFFASHFWSAGFRGRRFSSLGWCDLLRRFLFCWHLLLLSLELGPFCLFRPKLKKKNYKKIFATTQVRKKNKCKKTNIINCETLKIENEFFF